MKSKRQSRASAADDIERELRNARHYLQLLQTHEREAQAAEMTDAEALRLAKEAFLRDLSACLNATRTAKNYMTAATDKSEQRTWLDGRLAAPTFKFHADIAGTIFHDGSIALSRSVGVNINMTGRRSTSFEVVTTVDGSVALEPRSGGVTRIPTRFIYNADDLGPVLAQQLASVSTSPSPIVDLLDECIGGLEQTAKSAARNGRL